MCGGPQDQSASLRNSHQQSSCRDLLAEYDMVDVVGTKLSALDVKFLTSLSITNPFLSFLVVFLLIFIHFIALSGAIHH